jgi:dCMP deaminase
MEGIVENISKVSLSEKWKTSYSVEPVLKRDDVLSWDEYFMATAVLSSQRSKDPATQVGSCLVNQDNLIVGIGYNGFPRGCSDDHFPWNKTGLCYHETKYPYVVHAEVNAVMNNIGSLKGCVLYTTLFPCEECTKIIIQSGIKKIIYQNDKHKGESSWIAATTMLDAAKVSYEEFISTGKKIELLL